MSFSLSICEITVPSDIPEPTPKQVERAKAKLKRGQRSWVSVTRQKHGDGYTLRTRTGRAILWAALDLGRRFVTAHVVKP